MRLPVLAVSTMLAPVLLAQTRVPEVEPNNIAATAQTILIGDQIDSALVAGEQDWYSFAMPAAGRVRIHTSHLDTRIALLDATGATYLAIDEDGRTSTNLYSSELQLNLAAGLYTIQVVGFAAGTNGSYSLEVGSITPVVHDGLEVEPNDTHLAATPTGILGVGAKRFHGVLSPNTVVFSGTVDVPAAPPVVFSGAVIPPSLMFSGVVTSLPASTTTVTQSANPLSQPMANPLLNTYTPGMNISMTSGANIGLARLISANLAFAITSAAFPVANGPGDTYDIVTTNTTSVTWVGSLPLANMYVASNGYQMRMTSGANMGLTRLITFNTGPSPFGSEITVASTWPVANAPGDTFDIECLGSVLAFRTLTPLVPNVWNPPTGTLGLGHFHVRFTSGVNAGLYRQITGNTGTSITLGTSVTAPAAGDTFDVELADADYYQVVLTAPKTGLWFQINEGDNGMVWGHRYELYDAAGNALLPQASLTLPAFGTQSGIPSALNARTSSARVWPAGTYYIAVRNVPTPFTAPAVMPLGVVPNGPYMLELFTMPMNTGGTIAEAELPATQVNNTIVTAEPFVPGQVIQGNVTDSAGADPSDWFGPIVLTAPSTITYQTCRNAAALTPMLDSTITLRDSTGATTGIVATTGNLLDVPSSASSGPHGRTVVTFYLAPGTYYIDVTSPGTTAGMFGDYELETSVLMPAPYVAASYVTIASNAGCGTAPQPVLTRQSTTEVPATGTLFSRQLTNMTPLWVGLHVMGMADVPALDLALPFGGTLGACFLNVSPDIIGTVYTDAAGAVELQTFIPGSISLRGVVLWEQGFDFDCSAPNGLCLQAGNYGRFLIGERSY